jgi:uroporphyrin-III C-methyltransferase
MSHDLSMGRVRLVGAGPGPADLLTVRAQRAIAAADALLYDALISDEVLALAPRACTRIQTGKRAGRSSMAQETINRLMLRLARRGLSVVRLKGGDPSIFGRVGEELEFLEAHGVAVEVVPGVTAACAAAAQFAFPLTHRGVSRQVVFATARTQDGQVYVKGPAAVDRDATLVLYMARDCIGALFGRLIAEGWPTETPAAAIENAGSIDACSFRGDLRTLPAALSDAAPGGPVLVVVGQVATRVRQLDEGSSGDPVQTSAAQASAARGSAAQASAGGGRG